MWWKFVRDPWVLWSFYKTTIIRQITKWNESKIEKYNQKPLGLCRNLYVCSWVCVCVCVRARVRMCVCVGYSCILLCVYVSVVYSVCEGPCAVCVTQLTVAVEYTDCISAEGVRPHLSHECLRYDTKQSDGEAPVMLELWGSTPLLPSLPGPIWTGVVVPDRVLSMGQIKLCTNKWLMLNWIAWNRTVSSFNYM